MKRQCGALGCPVKVAEPLFLCPRHWALVPSDLRLSVWWMSTVNAAHRLGPSWCPWMRAMLQALVYYLADVDEASG